jgi:hypothetical protein
MSNEGRVIMAGFEADLQAAVKNKDPYEVRFNLNAILTTSVAFDIGVPESAYVLIRDAFDRLDQQSNKSLVLTTTRRDLSIQQSMIYIAMACYDLAPKEKKMEVKQKILIDTGISTRTFSRWEEAHADDDLIKMSNPWEYYDEAVRLYTSTPGRDMKL